MPITAKDSVQLNRRRFIKASTVGVGTITGALGTTGCTTTSQLEAPADSRFKFLRSKDVVILTALSPAILPAEFSGNRAESQAKLDQFLPQLDKFFLHSSNHTQVAVADLFDQLYFAPTRILLTGMWTSWENATPQQIDSFLLSWRDSSFNLFRGGYGQLTQMVTTVWYAQPQNWPATHYPGPPEHIVG